MVDKDGRPTKKGIILYLQDRQRRGLDLDEPVPTNGHQLPPPALPRNDLRDITPTIAAPGAPIIDLVTLPPSPAVPEPSASQAYMRSWYNGTLK